MAAGASWFGEKAKRSGQDQMAKVLVAVAIPRHQARGVDSTEARGRDRGRAEEDKHSYTFYQLCTLLSILRSVLHVSAHSPPVQNSTGTLDGFIMMSEIISPDHHNR